MNNNLKSKDSSSTLVNSNHESNQINEARKYNPLPYPQFIILILVRFVEPIAFTIVFPFVYAMVKDFGIAEDESQIGFYAGLLTSAFAVSEACTSIFWGILSDRIGRKPVVLFGLFGSAISLFLFGLSPNYTTAMIARSMSGVLNGNVGVVKSIVAELTDETNRAEAFGYLSLTFGFGITIGPLIGGFLSKPTEFFPSIFGRFELLKRFPYFLPCAVGSALCLAALVFGAFYLEETLESKKKKVPETSPLLEDANQFETEVETQNYGAITSTETVDTVAPANSFKDIPLNAWIVIFSYSLLLMFIVMFDESIVFWGAASQKQGGFGLIPPDFATIMASGGISMFVIQFTVFTAIKERFGILRIYQNVYLFFAIVCILTPFSTSFIPFGSIWSNIAVSLSFIIRSIIGLFAFNACNVLLANATPNNSMLGLINGVSQTLSCVSRAIAPTLAGYIFSWSLSSPIGFPFDIHFVWFFIAFVAFVNHILTQFIAKH